MTAKEDDTITIRVGDKDAQIPKKAWELMEQFRREKEKNFGNAIVDNFLNPPEKHYKELKEYFKEL